MAFCHLHLHDTYSLLDGYGLPINVAERSAELGLVALAETNHGTISGHIAHKKACDQHGIHSVFGCEFYIVSDMTRKGLTDEQKKQIKDRAANKAEAEKMRKESLRGANERSHIVAFAMNDKGYQNLRALVSLSFLEGFYRKPRIDYKTLLEYKEGLFITTACQLGDVPKSILKDDFARAKAIAVKLNERLEGNFALEIMPFDMEDQRKVNLGIQALAEQTGIRTIATNDVHYIREEDSWSQEVLLAIGTGATWADEKRFKFGNGELYLRSESEMLAWFKAKHTGLNQQFVEAAMNNTYDLAFQFQVNPLKSIADLPAFPIPRPSENADEYLRFLCGIGWKRKGFRQWPPHAQKVYGERVKYELGILRDKGFANYFLIVWDLVLYAKARNIGVGPARGSSAGSLVAFLTGITDIDPIRFGLSFERFIAPHRTDYPDIDIDFEDARRSEVRGHLVTKYGEDKVGNVATFNTLGFRSAFRDAARVFRVPQSEVDRAIGYFEEGVDEEDEGGIDATTMRDFKRKYPDVMKAAISLQGQMRSGGTHAAGVVVSNKPLKEITAIELRNKAPVVALTKNEAEALGLVKIDILGLRTMTVLSWAIKKVNEKRKKKNEKPIKLEDLTTSLDDRVILAEFAIGNTEAVFQFNKPGGKRLCRDIGVGSFDDLVAVNALDRPGPLQSGGTDDYLKNRKIGMSEPIHPIYGKVAKETYGVLLFQEQVMQLCRDLAGLDWADVHAIRKAISKSMGAEALEEFWEKFRDGAVGSGNCEEPIARKIWDQILKWGGYAFNKSHSVAYAAIGYATMWLKVYYPAEYLCGAMLYGTNPREAVLEARKRGVSVKEPHINKSGVGYSLIGDEVYAGLDAIKGIGSSASAAVIEARGEEPFENLDSFIERVPRRKVHKGIVRGLIEVGTFESIHPNTAALLEYHAKKVDQKGKLDLFAEENKITEREIARKVKLPMGLLMKRVELLPFLPEHHPGLDFDHVLERLDKLYPKRSTIVGLRDAGRRYARNEVRTITGVLSKFEFKTGDYGTRRKVGLASVEDETGEIVIRMDLNKFGLEIQQYDARQKGMPIVAVVSPISEYRADVRELGSLLEFEKGLGNEEYLTDSMMNLLNAPGRVVAPFRRKHQTLKKAIKLKKPVVIGLAMRVWAGNTKNGEMGFVDMADESGQQIILIWPKSWEMMKGEIQEGKIYEASLGTTKKDQTLCFNLSDGNYFRKIDMEAANA